MKGGIGMKHFKKILLIPLFLITACLIMTGCAKTAVQEETENKAAIEAADVASIQDFTDQQFAQQLVKANYEDFQSRVDSGEVVISRIFDNDLAQRWKTFTEKHGAIQKAEVAETNKTDDGYNCKLILTGEDGKMMALTITYDKGGYPLSTLIEDYTDDATKTVGSKMGEAGINIVVGLGVVFLILAFLTFFISLFKYLNVAGRKKAAAPAPKPVRAPVQTAAPAPAAPAPAEIPLAGNGELIAVITAAIAASEGTSASPNGYVVRSIRRLNSNKWR
jgi:sodium pump decarboxylase gamma subunit